MSTATDQSTEHPSDQPTDLADEELQWHGDQRRIEVIEAISVSAMARRLPQLVVRAVKLGWQVDRLAVAALLGCLLLSAALGAAGLYATTGTIAAVFGPGRVADRLAHAAPSIAVIATAAALRAVLGIAIRASTVYLSPRISREASAAVLRATVATELTAYDRAGYADELEAADRGAEAAVDVIGEAQNLVSSVGSLVGAAGVLTVLHPLLLPLLVLAALPQGFASVYAARVQFLANKATSGDRRILLNLRWYIHQKSHADQVRSDTMGTFLLDKYELIGRRLDVTTRRAAREGARVSVLGAAASGLGTAVVWLVMLYLVSTGRMSLPRGGAAVVALGAVGSALRGIVGYGADLFRTGMYLDDWSAFLDKAGGHALHRGPALPERPTRIELKDVSYGYPSSERAALDAVSLHVETGEILALVGENGSGKTTIAKAIAGLYLPDDGAVLWDGRDTRELDPHALWQHVAVVPQNYARWPLTARENITLGRAAPDGDEAVVRAAAASGADEVVAKLRRGLGTLLAVEWMGGEELSGGQWQRIAIARAFYRDSGLLVLDEPTAALDPRAEHKIFANLREVARDRAVVLVTHRLTNVAVADRIVVLEDGRVIQQGSFDELVAQRGGKFRELWDLQHDRSGVPAQRETRAGQLN
ncbi:ABC transporter ATP-binding protein [Kitasatospora viridis]|uniref:ATP-binding cassette subfamily B protein n=1 Tax=Kitasatospora viridis TaxID=281105 RepID=A0A561T698_9ACTN|nr:ABC transporter ATP-binding protein [Kitasatospora viridis]TWF82628.1 ATP-binding cassette subfamily B protein [Kitasatospora viridis]